MSENFGDLDASAAGDRPLGDTVLIIGSTDTVNGGRDTLITLNDDSTILLKGVRRIGSTFFAVGLGGMVPGYA